MRDNFELKISNAFTIKNKVCARVLIIPGLNFWNACTRCLIVCEMTCKELCINIFCLDSCHVSQHKVSHKIIVLNEVHETKKIVQLSNFDWAIIEASLFLLKATMKLLKTSGDSFTSHDFKQFMHRFLTFLKLSSIRCSSVKYCSTRKYNP